MRRILHIVLGSLSMLALLVGAAAGQDGSDSLGAVRHVYQGVVPFQDGEREITIEVDREPIAFSVNGKRILRGWRFEGLTDTRDKHFFFEVYGASASLYRPDADPMEIGLVVNDFGDSIIGYFDGRIDTAGWLVGIWRRPSDSSAATLCTLRLEYADTIEHDKGRYFSADFIPFWNRFRDALRRRDRRKVASMIRFPLVSRTCLFSAGSDASELYRREFLREFDEIFGARAIAWITRLDPLQIETEVVDDGKGWGDGVTGATKGTVLYVIEYSPFSEFSVILFFMRVNGGFKLAGCTCIG